MTATSSLEWAVDLLSAELLSAAELLPAELLSAEQALAVDSARH